MLKIEKFVTPSPDQWEIIIEGMRNPKNSWDRMDSEFWISCDGCPHGPVPCDGVCTTIGPNDHTLMMQLADGGPVHAKYRRMIDVFVTINAPFYWWKEFDTYKIGTVCNSCSTMHKIHAKEFTMEDFSNEHLIEETDPELKIGDTILSSIPIRKYIGLSGIIGKLATPKTTLECVIIALNYYRIKFLEAQKKPMKEESKRAGLVKKYWWQMIQLLPTSYNQKRTIKLNYEVLHNIYTWRRNHKLDEWHIFCDWIEELPYSELIIGEREEKK